MIWRVQRPRINAIELRGLDQREHDGGPPAAAIGAREEPSLAANRLLRREPLGQRFDTLALAGLTLIAMIIAVTRFRRTLD